MRKQRSEEVQKGEIPKRERPKAKPPKREIQKREIPKTERPKKQTPGKERWKFPGILASGSWYDLRLRYRILLYLFMAASAALSMADVAWHLFSEAVSGICYGIAALTLGAGSWYLVRDIRRGIRDVIRPGIAANPYTGRLMKDYRLRTLTLTVPGGAGNVIFAIINGAAGLYAGSAWFGSLSAYYLLLGILRFGAVRQAEKIKRIPDRELQMAKETAVSRKSSALFPVMAVVLAGMVILLQKEEGGKTYPGFLIYAAAAYAFYRIIMSVVQMVKAKKEKSPLLMTVRKIGYIDACVSVFTLQTAMLTAFGTGEKYLEKRMNGLTGSVICVMVLGMGIHGIWISGRRNRR